MAFFLICLHGAAALAFIAPLGKATLLFAIRPNEANEVLFGLAKCHKCAQSECDGTTCDGSANSAVNILFVADLGYCGSRILAISFPLSTNLTLSFSM